VRADLLRGYVDQEKGSHDIDLYLRPFHEDEGRTALMTHLLALDSAETQAIASRLKDIVSPTAIVWGERDPFLPVALGERLQAAIPRSTLEVVPAGSHFLPHESAHAVANTIGQLLKR
jgi:pimeloyl-ACP methyl ester carboxylesterase